MIFIVDTDALSLLEKDDSAEGKTVHSVILQMRPGDVFVTTIVTYEEQMRGWMAYAARRQQGSAAVDAYRRLARHLEIYQGLRVLGFDDAAETVFRQLRSGKIRIGTPDLRIAAIALSMDATLVSRNLRDFRQVPGLRVEDWTRV